MLREPSYHALRAFEATVRLGSLSAAADELNVTPGAISRQINALEEHMGRRLLGRSRAGLAVDSAGRTFAEALAASFSDIRQAVSQAIVRSASPTVTLNVYPTFAIQWLMPRLGDFTARAPDVDLRIRPSTLDDRFDNEDIDAAISIGQLNLPGIRSIELFPRLFTPICSPRLLEESGRTGMDLLAGKRIFYSERQVEYWRRWLELGGIDNQKLLANGVRFENSSLTYQATREGQGFAIGQPILLESDLSTGRLVSPFDLQLTAQRGYFLNFKAPAEPWPALNKLVEWMSEATKKYRTDPTSDAQ